MMNFNISQEHMEQIIKSVVNNPSIEAHIREEIVRPIRIQLNEQIKGGSWKKRLREQGMVL